MTKPVVLCILDGWGMRADRTANAVALAHTPVFDGLMATCPNTTLIAQGNAVGLPEGQMGNSEVGHTNIGAGRVVWMDLPRIDNAIEDGSFDINPELTKLALSLRKTGGTAHIAGLISPGGVHAHQNHIVRAVQVMCAAGVPVAIHAFLDGRDVGPRTGKTHMQAFLSALPEEAQLATMSGRFYALDRDNRWDRVKAAYDVMAHGDGGRGTDALDIIEASYGKDVTDEFLIPTALGDYGGMKDGDGLLFMNFRADRAREILSALVEPDFDGFDAGKRPIFAGAVGLVSYSDALDMRMEVMFARRNIVNTLGSWVASHGLTQFRIAETEKYPHVTFFLNGGREATEDGEQRYIAPSPKVRTYDMQPEMSAAEVTEHLCDAISSGGYDLIVVNFANPDMVGHTGDLNAAIAACEAVDAGVGAVVAALQDVGGAMLLTADHGNCETMIDPETGGPHTAHTLNPVPLILVGGAEGATLEAGGKLGDLAPSLLSLMQVEKPPEMTGNTLVRLP